MTHIAPSRIAGIARSHLGEQAPTDTCCSLGMNKWPQELGLPGIGTNSVTEAERRARAGHNGWSYLDDVSQARIGDFADWEPEVLGSSDRRHVTVIEEFDERGRIRGIGAGGPTGKVYWQPQNQGFNPPSYFRGVFRPPTETTKTATTSKPRTSPVKTSTGSTPKATYVVKRGDDLTRIASRYDTTVGKLVKLNRLRNPDHIEVGQTLKLR